MKIQFRNTFSTTLPRMTQKGTQGRESASQKFFAAVVRNRGTADHEQSTRKFLEVAVTSLPWPSQGRNGRAPWMAIATKAPRPAPTAKPPRSDSPAILARPEPNAREARTLTEESPRTRRRTARPGLCSRRRRRRAERPPPGQP